MAECNRDREKWLTEPGLYALMQKPRGVDAPPEHASKHHKNTEDHKSTTRTHQQAPQEHPLSPDRTTHNPT